MAMHSDHAQKHAEGHLEKLIVYHLAYFGCGLTEVPYMDFLRHLE